MTDKEFVEQGVLSRTATRQEAQVGEVSRRGVVGYGDGRDADGGRRSGRRRRQCRGRERGVVDAELAVTERISTETGSHSGGLSDSLDTVTEPQQRLAQSASLSVSRRCLLGAGYNYDSTAIRLQFDRATTIRRPTTSRPGCSAAA